MTEKWTPSFTHLTTYPHAGRGITRLEGYFTCGVCGAVVVQASCEQHEDWHRPEAVQHD